MKRITLLSAIMIALGLAALAPMPHALTAEPRSPQASPPFDLELVVGKELHYRTNDNSELRPVPLAGVSKLLRDGQTIVIRVSKDVPADVVTELIKMSLERKKVTVTVAPPEGAMSGEKLPAPSLGAGGSIEVAPKLKPGSDPVPDRKQPKTLEVGDVAPPVLAPNVESDPITLKQYRGKYVLLNFWTPGCAKCQAEFAHLKKTKEAFAHDGRLVILGLSLDKEAEADIAKRIAAIKAAGGIPWVQGFLGEESPVAKSYRIEDIPATFLIGPDGKILAKGLRGEKIKEVVVRELSKAGSDRGAPSMPAFSSMSSAPGASVKEETKVRPLSPETILETKFEGKATVEVLVAEVEVRDGERFGGGVSHMPIVLHAKVERRNEGREFMVVLSKETVTRLRQLGIEDLSKHFGGKVLRVSGIVDRHALPDRFSFYRLHIVDLTQLESIRMP